MDLMKNMKKVRRNLMILLGVKRKLELEYVLWNLGTHYICPI